MAAESRGGTMLGMFTPTVTETPLRLEPVTADDFIADLCAPASELVANVVTLPRRGPSPVTPYAAAA
jgi:hypothetical protein